jgi:hypothetical protein
MPRRALLLPVLFFALAGGVPAPAHAAGIEPTCVLLFSDGDGETLINRCRSCREVTLQRVRDGEGIPNFRSLMLPAMSRCRGRSAVPVAVSWAKSAAAGPRFLRSGDPTLSKCSAPARQNHADRDFLWKRPR